jgi:hypothetical protein
VRVLLFCLMVLSIPAIYREVGKGFRVDKLVRCAPRGAKIQKVDAHFYYMDQGSQSYVFESQDGTKVLKLFRKEQSRNPISQFVRTVVKGKPLRQQFAALQKRYYTACRIASELAPEETALVVSHIEPSGNWPRVRLHLPHFRKIDISLEEWSFVIQEKGERIFSVLEAADTDHMGKKLRSLRALLKSRAGKGIVNLDSDIHRNFGFVGDRAVELDFGAYELSSTPDAAKEVNRFACRISSWLKKHRPEWVEYWERLE